MIQKLGTVTYSDGTVAKFSYSDAIVDPHADPKRKAAYYGLDENDRTIHSLTHCSLCQGTGGNVLGGQCKMCRGAGLVGHLKESHQ